MERSIRSTVCSYPIAFSIQAQARRLGYRHVRHGGVTFVPRFGSALNLNRPLLAYGRLQQLDHGDLAFALKTPWDNGTTHLVFEPLEFIGRLVTLTPPPRLHLIRYQGVLAPHATDRALIVPSASHAPASDAQPSAHPTPPRSTPMTWAQLLARVFLADALLCPHGGARLP